MQGYSRIDPQIRHYANVVCRRLLKSGGTDNDFVFPTRNIQYVHAKLVGAGRVTRIRDCNGGTFNGGTAGVEDLPGDESLAALFTNAKLSNTNLWLVAGG